jgi:hypothetical protein
MKGLVWFIAIILLIAISARTIYRYKIDMKSESIDSTLNIEMRDTTKIEEKILRDNLDL